MAGWVYYEGCEGIVYIEANSHFFYNSQPRVSNKSWITVISQFSCQSVSVFLVGVRLRINEPGSLTQLSEKAYEACRSTSGQVIDKLCVFLECEATFFMC